MAAGVMMARAINVSSSDCILIPDQAIMYLKLNSLLQERDNELSSESGKGENETYSEFSQQLVQDITLREQFGESLSSTLTSIVTAWKVSKYGVFLVRIFLYSDWIRRFTE